MDVVEVGAEIVIEGALDPGSVVAFADHGVGVVVASDGARATVRPARGAAPAPGDPVTEGARWTHPFLAPTHAHGGVSVGLGAGDAVGAVWAFGTADAWMRWGPVVAELDAVTHPPTVAVTGRVGAEWGWGAGGVELGVSPSVSPSGTYAPSGRPALGPWARVGGRDGLHGQLGVGFGSAGPTDLDVRLQVPLGRDVAVRAEANFPLADPRALDRDGVGLVGDLRRWGGPGTVLVEGWGWIVADEAGETYHRPRGIGLELRGGYRW